VHAPAVSARRHHEGVREHGDHDLDEEHDQHHPADGAVPAHHHRQQDAFDDDDRHEREEAAPEHDVRHGVERRLVLIGAHAGEHVAKALQLLVTTEEDHEDGHQAGDETGDP